ncbi:MAG: ATP-binding protein [Steroidobacteraceae bacterium]
MLAGSVQVRVADTGIGMSDETLDGLFQPFHQGPNAIGRRYGGTGLGLAISRELALLMGGTLHVESTLGEGSAFTFICSAPATDLPVRTHVDTVLGGRGRVLVVEDSPANRLPRGAPARTPGLRAPRGAQRDRRALSCSRTTRSTRC